MSSVISDAVTKQAAEAFIAYHNRQHEQKTLPPSTPSGLNFSIEESKFNSFVSLNVDVPYGDARFLQIINVFFIFQAGYSAAEWAGV